MSADVHLDDAALAFHRDDALLEGFEEGSGVGDAFEAEVGGGVVVGDDGDGADAEEAVQQRLVELDVIDMPEFEGIDALGEDAAFVVDAVVADAVVDGAGEQDRDGDDEKGGEPEEGGGPEGEVGPLEDPEEDGNGDQDESDEEGEQEAADLAAELGAALEVDFLAVVGGLVRAVVLRRLRRSGLLRWIVLRHASSHVNDLAGVLWIGESGFAINRGGEGGGNVFGGGGRAFSLASAWLKA